MTLPQEVGLITSGVYQLRRLVSESTAFQTRVEAADATAAALKVKVWDYEDDPAALQRARPFACVWPADQFDMTQVAGGGQSLFSGGMDLVLILTDVDRAPGDREASGDNFAGWLDLVLQDIAALAGVDDHLPIKSIRFLQRPARSAAKDEPSAGAYWEAAILVSTHG